MSDQRVDHAAAHLRSEFDALPRLHLTFWQARRLLNLSDALCDGALAQLLDTGYLVRSRAGGFRRSSRIEGPAIPTAAEQRAR